MSLFSRRPTEESRETPVLESVSGTLTSPLNESRRLPSVFIEVLTLQAQLERRYKAGELSAAEYAASLANLVIALPDGSSWTIGASTKLWYSKADGDAEWRRSIPPTQQ